MITAARIAHLFYLDPVAVLDEPDWMAARVREAAYQIIGADMNRQTKSHRA